MDIFNKVADRKIQEAMDEGKFDNLEGEGKPLAFDDDPLTPAHQRMANKVLKNAGVLPDWVQVDKEIDLARGECLRLWKRVEKEYPLWEKKIADAETMLAEKRRKEFAAWYVRTRQAYLRSLREVNTEILKSNMKAPSVARVHIPYKIEAETSRFDAAFPAPPGTDSVVPPAESKRADQGGLRVSAQILYQFEKKAEK